MVIEMPLLGSRPKWCGQKCIVMSVFGGFGLASLFLLGSHFWAEVEFDSRIEAGPPYPADTGDNLFHFIQVSDLHISTHFEPERTTDFYQFAAETVPLIKPEVLLITGDLVDAKSKNKLTSVQYKHEWDEFSAAASKIPPSIKVMSIRGNHDSSNELSFNNSMYRRYLKGQSIQNEMITIEKPFGNYSLIAIDATTEPGFKRPFNFVGYISDDSVAELKTFRESTLGHNQTVLYGHYTTSTLYRATQMRDLFSSMSIAYLCGHLHNGGGMIPRMQHMHTSGVAELELADWKKNRYFRVLSFDHDIFSFTDHKWSQDLLVVHITNPPKWHLTNPSKQPVDRIRYSTHVRALIFSTSQLGKIVARIDGQEVQMKNVKNHLWAAPWSPKLESEGTVEVIAFDVQGKNATCLHKYNVNYTRVMSSKYSATGTFILSVDFCVYFAAAFWLGFAIPLFFMFTMSKIYSRISGRQPLQLKWNFLLRFQIMFGYEPYCTHLTLPLALWSIWVMTMPWFAGNIIDGDPIDKNAASHYGFVSTWGIFYHGHLYKSHEVFANGFWDCVTFLWPTLLCCSYFSERKWSSSAVGPFASIFNMVFLVLMMFILWLRVFAIYSISSSYGAVAAVSPVFLTPPCFILYALYFIYFKSSVNRDN